jgi:DNA-binding MarR family transcriptional regulator
VEERVTEEQWGLNELERELTLLARHYMSVSRVGQQLERSAYLLLTRLEVDEPMTLKQLAKAFHVDISTINRQTAAMLRQGLVERIPDPDGGMARKVRPTTLGLKRLAEDREKGRAGTGRVVDKWPDERVADLARLLTAFNKEIEGLEGAAWPRRTEDPAGK